MIVLNGVENFLSIINENWTVIVAIIGLGAGLYKKVMSFLSKSVDEQVEIAKTQVEETMLELVTEAEYAYSDWVSAGSIKRSQVIAKIFATYPILSKIADQTALIEWIDETINTALKTLRKILSANEEESE